MAKGSKKRSESMEGEDSVGSTPSESEGTAVTPSDFRCPHVGKAVHMAGLKKTLKVAWTKVGQCSPCLKEQRSIDAKNAVNKTKGATSKDSVLPPCSAPVDPNKTVTIWMCLRCGLQLCDSNSTSNHYNKHLVVPRSDLHCLAVNLMTWKLYCSECVSEVHVDSYKKTREAVDFIKRMENTKGKSGLSSGVKEHLQSYLSKPQSITSTTSSTASASNGPQTTIPKARGLVNLGNTCFFNAVMQSLNQTHPLTNLLDQHCQKGALFHVPSVPVAELGSGGKRDISSSDKTLEAMSLQLAEAGPMTLAVAAFFKEMSSIGKQGVVNPGHLFGQVCRKSPQFRGFHQQDAHELLRHLMDGLRAEEVKRQKCAILKTYNLNEKTDPKSVPVSVKRNLQAVSRFSSHTIVDKLFGGHLVSTIVCEQCHNSSQIYEPFLDLSLPLIEEKPHRPNHKNKHRASQQPENDEDEMQINCFGGAKKKPEEDDANESKSKYQSKKISKKEKRKLKKEKRKQSQEVKIEVLVEKEDEDLEEEEQPCELEKEQNSNNLPNDNQEDTIICNEDVKSDSQSVDDKLKESEIKNDGDVNGDIIELEDPSISKFNKLPKEQPKKTIKPSDGNEEDDEDDGYSEGKEDWEWDYGEEWEEGDEDNSKKDEASNGTGSEYLEIQTETTEAQEEKKVSKENLVSLNPLPKEAYERISSEREKSAETQNGEEEEGSDVETGASFNGDVEDNLDESTGTNQSLSGTLFKARQRSPFHPDPNHLDPHMERLCRQVRKMSVASVNVCSMTNGMDVGDEKDNNGQKDYVLSEDASESSSAETNRLKLRLQNDWIARSLTSIAPRYHSTAGECSVYSCLTQFTAPELLTGNNKWACTKCTKLNAAKESLLRNNEDDLEEEEEDASGDKIDMKKKREPKTMYSNASKQLLIYSPPAILTIHLKRFQQTMFNLRKVSRHIDFPMSLDLAPFCSTTSISTSSVSAGAKEILYDLYGIVEHSGSLQGGHYTAYIKVRASNADKINYSDFFTTPTAKNEEIDSLISEIERKQKECSSKNSNESSSNQHEENSDQFNSSSIASKWYCISDSHVSEVSVDKVMKSQAYILFYERIK